MAQPDTPHPTKSSSRDPSRQRRSRGLLGYIWSEWRTEIFIILLVAFGIFLLVEQMQIRQTLLGWLSNGFQALKGVSGGFLQGVTNFVKSTTLSDLVGYALLLIALAAVAWRARWRLKTMPRFTLAKCPRCGSDLRRIHRHRLDHVLDLFIPVRRYRCSDRECRWRGLRVKKSRHE